jgi:hypothetical protein
MSPGYLKTFLPLYSKDLQKYDEAKKEREKVIRKTA